MTLTMKSFPTVFTLFTERAITLISVILPSPHDTFYFSKG